MTPQYFYDHGIPSIIAAVGCYVVGLILLALGTRMILTHPVNRALILSEYLTADGVRLVYRLWPIIAMLGVSAFGAGLYHHLHWLYTRHPSSEIAGLMLVFMGWVLATTVAILAVVMLYTVVKLSMRGAGSWRSK